MSDRTHQEPLWKLLQKQGAGARVPYDEGQSILNDMARDIDSQKVGLTRTGLQNLLNPEMVTIEALKSFVAAEEMSTSSKVEEALDDKKGEDIFLMERLARLIVPSAILEIFGIAKEEFKSNLRNHQRELRLQKALETRMCCIKISFPPRIMIGHA